MHSRRRRVLDATADTRKGVALIVALVVTVILVTIVLSSSYTTRIDLKLVRNQKRDLQGYFAARGAIALARTRLRADLIRDGGVFAPDSLNDPWAAGIPGEDGTRPGIFREVLGDLTVEYEIVDEDRKICLNNLAVQAIRLPKPGDAKSPIREGIPSSESLPPGEGKPEKSTSPDTSAAIDDLKGMAKERREMTRRFIEVLLVELGLSEGAAGAVAGQIEKGAPYLSVGELLRVDGVSPKLLYGEVLRDRSRTPGLRDFLTIYSMGAVNLNTAPPEVLRAVLSEISPGEAEEFAKWIIEYRETPVPEPEAKEEPSASEGEEEDTPPRGGVLAKIEDLAEVPGLMDIFDRSAPDAPGNLAWKRQLTVWSRFFSVRVRVHGGSFEREYAFVVKRGLTPDQPIPVLIWEERGKRTQASSGSENPGGPSDPEDGSSKP